MALIFQGERSCRFTVVDKDQGDFHPERKAVVQNATPLSFSSKVGAKCSQKVTAYILREIVSDNLSWNFGLFAYGCNFSAFSTKP